MWETLKKVHETLSQGRLNFLKRQFFINRAGVTESINDILGKLSQLQLIIRNIRESKATINLDVAIAWINFVDNESYTMAKYYLKDMRDSTLAHTKERLKLVK